MSTDELDPKTAARLAEYKAAAVVFPEIPIEAIAKLTWEQLIALRDKLEGDSVEEQSSDIRMRIFHNHRFFREDIEPIVRNLMLRTDPRGVYFDRKKHSGYEVIFGPDETDFPIEYTYRPADYLLLDNPGFIQNCWDKGGKKARSSLRSFSAMTRPQIVDHFIMYAEEYLEPGSKIAAQTPNDLTTPETL